jgi:hypothetical protein
MEATPANGGASRTDISGECRTLRCTRWCCTAATPVVGTEVGVFVGHRSGVSAAAVTTSSAAAHHRWQRLGHGQPSFPVWELAVGPNGQIEVGTHGQEWP